MAQKWTQGAEYGPRKDENGLTYTLVWVGLAIVSAASWAYTAWIVGASWR